jgi:CheY-like chemotaxis protein
MEKEKKNKTVLYIEDDLGQQRIYRRVFENAGYRFLTASNGESGIDLAFRERPSVVLLDLLLNGAHSATAGLDVLEQFRNAPELQSIPVVVFTNYTDERTLKKANELGSRDVIIKVDVTPHEIVAFLEAKYL